MAVEARVDEAGRRVDEQAEPAEARLALDAGRRGRRAADPLRRGAEHELAGVQDERVVVGDLDQLGEVALVHLHVDDPAGVVAEHPEVAVAAQVDRRRLQAGLVEAGR